MNEIQHDISTISILSEIVHDQGLQQMCFTINLQSIINWVHSMHYRVRIRDKNTNTNLGAPITVTSTIFYHETYAFVVIDCSCSKYH